MFNVGRHEGAETVKDHQKDNAGGSVLTIRRGCYKAAKRKENKNRIKGSAAMLELRK